MGKIKAARKIVGFFRKGGRVIAIRAKAAKGSKTYANTGGKVTKTLKSIGQNTKEVRGAAAKKINEARKAARSKGGAKFGETTVDIAPALKGVRRGKEDSAKRIVYNLGESQAGSPIYKQLGRGGPVDARIYVGRKGRPETAFVRKKKRK